MPERRDIHGQKRFYRCFREGQFSQVINTMRNAGIHFNKKLEEMQRMQEQRMKQMPKKK